MPARQESGLRDHRVEFVREDVDANGDPVTPSEPAWERPSDRMYSVEWGPTPGLTADRGLGDTDVAEHDKGPEEHEFTQAYALQRWFVDQNGDPSDLAGDGLLRDADGLLPNTHTIVDRESKGKVAPASTVEGRENDPAQATSKETRIYTVVRGGKVGEVTITVDPGDQQPANVEVVHNAEKVRRIQIDQPDAGTTLHVKTTDDVDTTQTLTIEDEGATSTEDASLNGTTAVTTTASFDNIDALALDAETVGDVEVYDGDPAVDGELLAVIPGADSYDGIEGDLGVPALGSGSHSSAIGSSFLRTLTDEITLDGSSDHWFDINSKEFSVDNNLGTTNRDDSLRMRITEGVRDTEMSVTTMGETQSYADARRALQNVGGDIVWTFPDAPTGNGTLTVASAKLTDPGLGPYEAEESTMSIDETFIPEGGGTAGLSVA